MIMSMRSFMKCVTNVLGKQKVTQCGQFLFGEQGMCLNQKGGM